MTEQPVQSEGTFLLYVLELIETRGQWALRSELLGDFTVMLQDERDALYALGRLREAICHRVKRLEPGEERDFLGRMLALCQVDDGGRPGAPRWPASNLGSIRGMISARLMSRRAAA